MPIKFTLMQQQAIQRGSAKRKRLVALSNAAARRRLTGGYKHTYIFSPPGLGKTYSVTQAVNSTGVTNHVISGAQSMFAFGVSLAVFNYYHAKNQPIVIVVDDCDEILKNEVNVNIMKNVLAGKKVFQYHKSLSAQWSSLTSDQQTAIEHHQSPQHMGFTVPTDRFIFIFTSNFRLPTDDEVSQARDRGLAKAALMGHRNAIRSRCKTTDFDLAWDEQWGWIADVVLNESCVDHLISTMEAKAELLDWMYNKWDNMTERSIRTAEKMAEVMVEDPTGYRDTWEIDYLK